ncbi:Forkhead transcription factor [Knufia fluminis]|uniref:Forkhead transcription factor n=1 Tax=Knufia fluminis TaxID=191047 RepID=A0AAN8EFW7_9EURO|nr:Forkhead transcription factor [Knufia fluminis]
MSPTRQPPPIQIYQDFAEPPAQLPPQKRPRPQLAPSAMPLQPTRNAQPPTYAALHPSIAMKQAQISPLQSQFPPIQQNYNPYGMMPHMTMPEHGPIYTDSPQKRMTLPSSQPLLPAPPVSQPLFSTWDSNFQHFEQENFHMSMPMPDSFADFPDPSQTRRAPLKRSYSETIPSNDKPFKRSKQFHDEEEDTLELPQPEDMPPIEDDGQKPPYSYAQMIGMAILRAPGRKLTLANIYDWISTTFRFYREDPKTGWHNSIRHNLSLNKAFTKQERPKSDAGKGCYWVIQPGMEAQFFKDKPRKNNGSINMAMQQAFGSQPTMQAMAQPIVEAIQPRPWIVQSQAAIPPAVNMAPRRPQTAPALDPALPELSSDATLPASDPALAEEEVIVSKEVPDLAPPSMPPPPSSPPVINSSPPVAPRHIRTISSPANITRHSAKQRRTQTGMDDSGYFSSLESSARRPRHGGVMPTSELGFVPKKRHGRAEEEIARIRSSSHDITPSGRRFRNAEGARSSSPVRQSPAKLPATPPVVFKKPFLPPQSISPNSQLRRHREAMQQFIGSPAKAEDVFGGELSTYSPAFKLSTPFSASFDDSLFCDFTQPLTPLGSSPIKASGRPSIQRSNTTVGVLSDVTKRANGKLNSKTPSKIPGNITLKAPTAVGYTGSPLKKSAATKHIEFYQDENENSLFDFGSFPDENSEEGDEELDISKGFSKIGSGNTGASLNFAKALGGLRPPLARSSTSRF